MLSVSVCTSPLHRIQLHRRLPTQTPVPPRIPTPALPSSGSGKSEFSMLGLGDIVIPGIFIAIVLRYDAVHGGRARFFISSIAGYISGLAATILIMNWFKAAQPALLYLVPAILATTLGHAALAGRFSDLLSWHEQEHHAKNGGKASENGENASADGGEKDRSDHHAPTASPPRRSARTKKET